MEEATKAINELMKTKKQFQKIKNTAVETEAEDEGKKKKKNVRSIQIKMKKKCRK